MKYTWLMVIPLFGFAQTGNLKSLIEEASKHNQNIQAKSQQIDAKEAELDAQKRTFWPTLDIGVSESLTDPVSLVSPGKITSGFMKIGMDIYDGGKRGALKRAKGHEYQAVAYEKEAFKKSVTLDIVHRYYGFKAYQAQLEALGEKSKALSAQMNRIRRFKSTGLAVQDDIDKLQAAYDENLYQIEAVKMALETQRQNLKLLSGVEIAPNSNSRFVMLKSLKLDSLENVKILNARADAIEESADAIGAVYRPQVRVEDTYVKSNYDDVVDSGFGSNILLDHQNALKISATMRLFDGGTTSKIQESLRYQKLALKSQKAYATQEQKSYFSLAKRRLLTVEAQLGSAKSGLIASRSSYKATLLRYEQGIADHIEYLEALTVESEASARLKAVEYDYEIAKSLYYYYAGKDPKEYVK